jgi:hypothetical protein
MIYYMIFPLWKRVRILGNLVTGGKIKPPPLSRDINREAWSSSVGVGCKADDLSL